MSRKELVLASAWIAAGLTYRVYPNDQEDHLPDMMECGMYYAPLIVEMVAAGWEMAMGYPEDYHRGCYEDVGEHIFEYVNENGGDLPPHDELVAFMIDNTCTEFNEIMNDEQVEKLRERLKAIEAPFKPYQ